MPPTLPLWRSVDRYAGSVIFVPPAGKIAIYLHEGEGFVALNKNGTDGRAESQLLDGGIDPFISGNPGDADTETDYSI